MRFKTKDVVLMGLGILFSAGSSILSDYKDKKRIKREVEEYEKKREREKRETINADGIEVVVEKEN